MALGPRLELRHSQSLVMTPQLRQAIKLLQFTNLEVAAFVEEEVERNPLLERAADELATPEQAAPDQRSEATPTDAADAALADTIPTETSSPLDADYTQRYDAGGPGDGVPIGRGGDTGFTDPGEMLDDVAESGQSLQEHLGAQLRLAFNDPADRLIGAHLIALLCPAGRLTAEPADIADAMDVSLDRVEAVRARMMNFDPVGLFARDLKECLTAQLKDRDRFDPAMAILLDNLDLVARRDLRRLLAICGVDSEDLADMLTELRSLDPKPGWRGDGTPPQVIVPDILMRASGADWILELNPQTLPRVLVN